MARIPIFNVAQHGVIKDIPDHKLPPEAWTDALNMRFIDDKCVRMEGDQSVMGTPTAAPGFIMNVEGTGGSFWIYAQAGGASSNVYAFNSNSHAEISKSGGYNVSNFREWNGCVFHGVPIVNPVSDDPQYWTALNLSSDLADLSNWPASTTCRIMRVYKNYLVALYTTESGTVFPHRVRWSSPASPGSLPGSWDDTDATVDAGLYELSDVNSGLIVDGMAIRDLFAIYKNDSTWLMRFKGGFDVMEFANVLQTSGILGPRCMVPLTLPINQSQVHFVMNGFDLGVFNGQGFESVIDKKARKYLVNDIDAINGNNSFVFDNPVKDEAWFCYPQNGETRPNMACIWNYRQNTFTFREFNGVHAASGQVELAGAATWATTTATWTSAASSKWQEGARRKVVTADQANTLLRQLDTSDTFNDTAFDSYLERTGIALVGVDRRTGEPKVDFERMKLVRRIWPKIKGGRVRVTVGKLNEFDSTMEPFVDYTDASGKNTEIFDPGSGKPFVDVINQGRLIGVKYEGVDGDYWEMDGYDIDIAGLGEH